VPRSATIGHSNISQVRRVTCISASRDHLAPSILSRAQENFVWLSKKSLQCPGMLRSSLSLSHHLRRSTAALSRPVSKSFNLRTMATATTPGFVRGFLARAIEFMFHLNVMHRTKFSTPPSQRLIPRCKTSSTRRHGASSLGLSSLPARSVSHFGAHRPKRLTSSTELDLACDNASEWVYPHEQVL
jgi:hypothetical protein